MISRKKILVTGADGFIGSHLVEQLAKKNKVTALSLYNSFNNHGWLENLDNKKNINIISGNIEDENICNEITKNVDIVFHLASLIAIPYSYLAPKSYANTNIIGTLNVCQSVLKNKVKKMIHISTSEVYGTAKYSPIDENHPLQPQSPYSASKISADSIAKSFFNSYNLPLIIARPFNTYGPRQSARAIIPTIISQFLSDKNVIKIGNLKPKRDFTYVKDTCKGLIILGNANKKYNGEEFNIGSGKTISVSELYKLIKDNFFKNSNKKLLIENKRLRPAKSEVFLLKCDNKKIKKLGFKQDYNFIKGLKETINWFKQDNNLNKYKTDTYNI